MDELKIIIASNLIRLRNTAGITQLELAERLNYSDKAVSKWERAESTPDVFVLKQIADIFGVTVDYIITAHDEWDKPPATVIDELKFRPKMLAAVVCMAIYTIAAIVFVMLWIIFGLIEWEIFVYALPVTAITLLVFNSIWRKGKGNIYIVSVVVQSIIATLYIIGFRQLHLNLWQIFIIAIPAEILVILSFHVLKRNKSK